MLDSPGASLHDARRRWLALRSNGAPVHAIACGAHSFANESPEPHVTWAGEVPRALALAERWRRTHRDAEILIASGALGGGALGRALAGSRVTWWPTAVAPRREGWLRRGGAARAPELGDGSDSVAALSGAVSEPPPAGRARAPLWDGDYLLAPLPLGRAAGAALLRAFAPVSSSWSGVDLVVLAPSEPALATLARRLGIGARVHFAGLSAARAERAWFASAAAIVLGSRGPVAATLVMRALSFGVPMLAVEDGPLARPLREWLAREGMDSGSAHERFGVESLARILERGAPVTRAVEIGQAIAARHDPDAVGARWRAALETRLEAA